MHRSMFSEIFFVVNNAENYDVTFILLCWWHRELTQLSASNQFEIERSEHLFWLTVRLSSVLSLHLDVLKDEERTYQFRSLVLKPGF